MSTCLEIQYGCPNWVFGSIYLETTRKFHRMQSPIHFGHHAPEKTGSMCEKTLTFTIRTLALGNTFGFLDFRTFSTLLCYKGQWKEDLISNEDGAWSHQAADRLPTMGGERALG